MCFVAFICKKNVNEEAYCSMLISTSWWGEINFYFKEYEEGLAQITSLWWLGKHMR